MDPPNPGSRAAVAAEFTFAVQIEQLREPHGELLGQFVSQGCDAGTLVSKDPEATGQQLARLFEFMTPPYYRFDSRKSLEQFAGETLDLAPREFALLHTLSLYAGQVVSVDDLLAQVLGAEYVGESQVVYVHIRWLREKIEADPKHPQRIVTLRGVGYKLQPQPQPPEGLGWCARCEVSSFSATYCPSC